MHLLLAPVILRDVAVSGTVNGTMLACSYHTPVVPAFETEKGDQALFCKYICGHLKQEDVSDPPDNSPSSMSLRSLRLLLLLR